VVNEKPNSANGIIELLGKGETLGDKGRETLSTAIVEAFDRIGQTRIFANGTMTFKGNNLLIGLPKIGISNSTLPINRGKTSPKLFGRLSSSIAQKATNNFPSIAVDS
jgi:hypothetical protein